MKYFAFAFLALVVQAEPVPPKKLEIPGLTDVVGIQSKWRYRYRFQFKNYLSKYIMQFFFWLFKQRAAIDAFNLFSFLFFSFYFRDPSQIPRTIASSHYLFL